METKPTHEQAQLHLQVYEMRREPRLRQAREWIHRAGGQPIGERLYFGYYYDVPAITEIITKAQRMLAFKPTDFAAGLKTTYRSYLQKRKYPRPDFTFEDELIHRFSALAKSIRTA